MAPTSPFTRYGLGAFYVLFAGNYITTYHYSFYFINGPSMAPFLSPKFHATGQKDIVLFKLNPRLSDDYSDQGSSGAHSELKRGMIVSFLSPTSSKMAVKRIVALGGDRITPLGRNGVSETAASRNLSLRDTEKEVTVPFGHVWVEGDQVDVEKTFDSNSYGPISKSLIKGIATRIIWPPSRSGQLEWDKGWEKRMKGRVTRTKDDHYLPAEWALY